MTQLDYIASAIKAAESAGIDALDFLEASLVMQAKTARMRPEDAPRIVECAQALAEYITGMPKPEAPQPEEPSGDMQSAPPVPEGTGATLFNQILGKFRR